jgi:hypothetical protein
MSACQSNDRKLAMLMRAFLSRPERWSVEAYEFPVYGGLRKGYRLTINGTIETDYGFLDAVEKAAEVKA